MDKLSSLPLAIAEMNAGPGAKSVFPYGSTRKGGFVRQSGRQSVKSGKALWTSPLTTTLSLGRAQSLRIKVAKTKIAQVESRGLIPHQITFSMSPPGGIRVHTPARRVSPSASWCNPVGFLDSLILAVHN